jgi:hypothetical protein
VLLNRFRIAQDPAVARAHAAIALVFGLNGALYGSWAARIPALQDRLDLGPGALGIALAGVATGAVVAMPLSGGWAARAGSRRATRAALAAVGVTMGLVMLSPSFGVLVIATLAMGAANGGLDVAMNAQGMTIERRARRLILGSLHAAFSGGGLVGAATASLAAAAGLDARVHLALVAGLALATGLPATRHLLPAVADAAPEGPAFARPTRALWALGVLAFCCLLAEGAAGDWSAVYVDDALDASAGVAGLAFAGFSASMTLGRLVVDRLVVALGPVRLLRRAGMVAGAGLAAALAVGSPPAAIAGFVALGSGLSVIVPLAFRGAAAAPGVSAGPAIAAVSTMGYLGFVAGPPMVGGVAELTSLPLALGTVALLAAATAALAPAARSAGRPVPAASLAEPKPA